MNYNQCITIKFGINDLPKGFRPIGCKQVFKTKKGSKRKVAHQKPKLVGKGFTQQEGVDYNEVFLQSRIKTLSKLLCFGCGFQV